MARPASDHPTEMELEILKLLWRSSPQPVSELRDGLETLGRNVAHTTVITITNIMVDKGYLDKSRQGKSYQYWPTVSEEEVHQQILGDLVTRVFDGSAKNLVSQLVDDEVDESELLELRKLINSRLREKRK